MNKSDHPCLSVCTSLGLCGRMGPLPASHPGSGPRPSVSHFHLVTSHMLPSVLVGSLPLSTPENVLRIYCFWLGSSSFSAQGSLPWEKSLLVPWSCPRYTGVHIHACLSLSCLCILSLHSLHMPLFAFLGKHLFDSGCPTTAGGRLCSLFSSSSSPGTRPAGIHHRAPLLTLGIIVPGDECST